MKLAVFTSKYPARVATFFERDMAALLEAGVELDIYSLLPLEPDLWRYSLDLLGPNRLPRDRVHHLTLPAAAAPGLAGVARRPWRAVRDATAVLASASRFGPVPFAKSAYVLPKAWAWAAQHADRYDHVLAYWGNYAGTCAYAFHRLLDRPIPFSIWLHAGTDLYRTPVYLRQKLAYADNVITCCEFNRGFLLDRFADLATHIAPRIQVCHHGLDLARFPFEPDERPPHRMIAVGRLSAHKGFDHLIRALHLLALRAVPAELEFVGDGEERGALERLAGELGVADRVRFRGWLPFADARQAMAGATVLVHPSDGLGDGLPNVIREAMALGTPVVATRVAGIPDALGDDCGVLVPPRNLGALADAIEGLLGAPARRLELAARARRRAEARYDLWRNGAALARTLRATRRPLDRTSPALASRPAPSETT